MKRIVGYLTISIGLIHTLVGVGMGYQWLADIGRDGGFDAVEGDHARMAIVWFLFTGLVLLVLGHVCVWLERQGRAVPAFVGWEMLALSIVGAFLMPVSGFWLLLVLAVSAVLVARSDGQRAAAATERRGAP